MRVVALFRIPASKMPKCVGMIDIEPATFMQQICIITNILSFEEGKIRIPHQQLQVGLAARA